MEIILLLLLIANLAASFLFGRRQEKQENTWPEFRGQADNLSRPVRLSIWAKRNK